MRPPAGGSMEENPNNGDERVSTVYINRDGAESIQWNWKLKPSTQRSTRATPRNPFNGIESPATLTDTVPHTPLENPFNGIESQTPARLNPASPPPPMPRQNPFNGIERRHYRPDNRPNSVPAQAESIQWNWKTLRSLLSRRSCCMLCWNPFNGIESEACGGDAYSVGCQMRIHSMELKAQDQVRRWPHKVWDGNPFNGIERLMSTFAMPSVYTLESIQWNWKIYHVIKVPQLYLLNPFNGIESFWS